MEEYQEPRIIPPEVAKMGGVTSEMARRCAWVGGIHTLDPHPGSTPWGLKRIKMDVCP
jgi:hypothetical protein